MMTTKAGIEMKLILFAFNCTLLFDKPITICGDFRQWEKNVSQFTDWKQFLTLWSTTIMTFTNWQANKSMF